MIDQLSLFAQWWVWLAREPNKIVAGEFDHKAVADFSLWMNLDIILGVVSLFTTPVEAHVLLIAVMAISDLKFKNRAITDSEWLEALSQFL